MPKVSTADHHSTPGYRLRIRLARQIRQRLGANS